MERIETSGLYLSLIIIILLLGACSEEKLTPTTNTVVFENSTLFKEGEFLKIRQINASLTNCRLLTVENPNLGTDCSITEFGLILSEYFLELSRDPYFDLSLVEYYKNLSTKYVTYYEGSNYYGEHGQYNQLAKKRIRDLKTFWKLDREIYLNGQHTISLDNRETLAAMIESFDNSVRNRTEAYERADELLRLNAQSRNFPENPTFAMDAFTKPNGLLVIGDGILRVLVDSGIDEDIAFTGILAHEWWHQAQFEYQNQWESSYDLNSLAERSRFIELEADFAAAYYLAHKRGATFNWKRIENYFQLSFNVGDCLVNSNQHHGTPFQRLAAAKLGYELAINAQKQGQIVDAERIHLEFLKLYSQVISK